MKQKRIKGTAEIRLNAYRIIDDIIENAIRCGYTRAHKHVDEPSEDLIVHEIHHAVMSDLCDVLKFDDE